MYAVVVQPWSLDPLLFNDVHACPHCGPAPPLIPVCVFEMCQPDVQGLRLLEAQSNIVSVDGKRHTWTPMCCSTSFLMSMYQAEVHLGKNECQLPAHGLLKKMTVIQTKYSDLTFYLIIYL